MRALSRVPGQHQRRLIPLATSAAAEVHGRELGVPAENLHKFLHEWQHGPLEAALGRRHGNHGVVQSAREADPAAQVAAAAIEPDAAEPRDRVRALAEQLASPA